MILNSLCNSCLQPFQILIEARDIPLVKQITVEDGRLAPCPRLCGGRINMVGDAAIEAMARDSRLKNPMCITGTELYKAVNGVGLPDEIPTSVETLESLLLANQITSVKLEEVNGVYYLHEARLSNGLTIHLAAGTRGAWVLKVTKERR